VNPDAAAQGAGRMLAHEDVDLFTLLPAGSQGGLQVLNRSNMKWVRLNAPEGSIIFNAGDYLQRITNDGEPLPHHPPDLVRTWLALLFIVRSRCARTSELGAPVLASPEVPTPPQISPQSPPTHGVQ
jgi:hypothetical protein